jgi:hypothetical protein
VNNPPLVSYYMDERPKAHSGRHPDVHELLAAAIGNPDQQRAQPLARLFSGTHRPKQSWCDHLNTTASFTCGWATLGVTEVTMPSRKITSKTS